jgi:hypothetical protein
MCQEAGITLPDFEEITGVAVVTFRGSVGKMTRPEVGSKVESRPESLPIKLDFDHWIWKFREISVGPSRSRTSWKPRRVAGKRNRKRRELFDAQDASDAQRDELIKRVEGQPRWRHTLKPAFTFWWRLV